MFNSANRLDFALEAREEGFLVLVLSYLYYLHCNESPRVYINSAENLDIVSALSTILEVWASRIGPVCFKGAFSPAQMLQPPALQSWPILPSAFLATMSGFSSGALSAQRLCIVGVGPGESWV